MFKLLLVIGVLLALLVVIATGLYNRLVALRNRYRNAFSQIDLQLKRRHDLIGNLVASVKGYLQHERGTLEAVAVARGEAMGAVQTAALNPGDAATMRRLGATEGALTSAWSRLLAVAEAYPDLKANQSVSLLMEEVTTTENRIALARQAYNDATMFYNTAVQTVPLNFIAALAKFEAAEFFQVEDAADRQTPTVSV